MANSRLLKTLGIGALVLALGTGLISCGKIAESKRKSEQKRIELGVSENSYTQDGLDITYDGMNNDKTFAVSPGNNNDAVDFFYPSNSKEINFYGHKLKVIEVTPKHIILER